MYRVTASNPKPVHAGGPRPLLLLPLLFVMMLLAAGCTIQPINAGERPNLPVPVGGQPAIAIAPTTAESGQMVAVAGAGWLPNEVVYLNLVGMLDGVDLQSSLVTTATDEAGTFTAEFIVPLDVFWQGTSSVNVVASSIDRTRTASAPFTFATATATPTLTPTLPPPATPTPTAAPVVPATPLPTAPPSTGNVATVVSAGLNLRTGPGTQYPVIRALSRGAQLFVLGQDRLGVWLYVQTWDGQLGWVARNFTDFRGNAPVVNPPPPPIHPTATPTAWPTAFPTFVPPPSGFWLGEYYANRFLAGFPTVVRQDSAIDFNWGYGSPAPGIPADNFSVRWTRTSWFDAGTYRFFANSDDGVRIWVDGNLLIDQWHNWSPNTYTADIYLGSGNHTVVVDYYEEYQLAFIQVWWQRIDQPPPPDFPQWKGRYYSNRNLSGDPTYVRNDERIDFNWGTSSPAPGVPSTNFSVKWTRKVDFSRGWYRLYARSDDGIRVFVDGNRVINEWRDQEYGPTYTADVFLDGDTELKVEYFQHRGSARVKFWWERISSPTPTATPTGTPTATRTPTPSPTPVASNPYADANPSSGGAGTQVNISFGNFPPNTVVNLYAGSYVRASDAAATSATVLATTTSDRFGRGSLRFTIPATWPDGAPIQPGKLALLVATGDFSVAASADFTFRAPRPTVAPNPYVEVNPRSGGAGTAITVQGGGFPAGALLNIFLGGEVRAGAAAAVPPVAVAIADSNGNFLTTFAMPGTWPSGSAIGTGKIVVLVATADFSIEASGTFDFFVVAPNPAVSINPTAGMLGTPVTVIGSGFPANSQVGLYLAPLDTSVGTGEPLRYAVGTTDGSGRATLSFTIPSTWPNGSPVAQNRLVVTMARPDFSVSASAVFALAVTGPTWTPTPTPTNTTTPAPTATPKPNPSASLSPRTGVAGTAVTVFGGGFPANTPIYAHLAPLGSGGGNGPEYVNYASAVTSATGDYSMVLVLPAVWPDGTPIKTGRLVVLVATTDYAWQASASLDYTGVTGADAATTVPPTATATSVPPTSTTAPTSTPMPPTSTPVPPTATPMPPTATALPPTPTPEPPTATPPPPTDTPTPEPTATPVPPTDEPTDEPTEEPTEEPTATPTETPTEAAAVPPVEPVVTPPEG